MADNVQLNSGSGGATVRTLEDGSSIQWPAGVCAYAISVGTPDVLQIVTLANGLPVQPGTSTTWTVVNSGTFAVQAAQSGTWTVQPGNTANTTPWLVSIHDGTNKASVRDLGSSDALNVAICDGSGNQITSFGGGTQYTEGDTDTTITGTAMMWEDASDTLRAVSASKPLPVGDAGGSLTVDNAGTFAVQAAQSGTWNITNISGTVSLPTGAATAAKQPALGTAGTASSDVITVQGIASMTPVQVSQATASNLNATVVGTGTFAVQVTSLPASTSTIEVVGDAAHDAAAAGNPLLLGGYASAAAPSDVSADGDAVRLWALRNGALAVNVTAAGALVGGDATNGLDVDVTRVQGSVTVAQATAGNLNATVVGTGTFAVQAAQSGTWNVATVTNITGGSTAHDAAAGSVNPLLLGGYASAAAPTSVSADGDAVQAWFLRNGAQATVITAAGALIGGDATNGLDVDVTRVKPDGTNTMPSLDTAGRAGFVKVTDGTTTSTVLSLSNSNALVAAIVDGSGNQITSFGGGTQYTEDAAAAANPVGTVPILVRADTPAGAVSADGDNIAQRGSNYGAAYVTLVDSGGNFVSVGGGTQYTEDAAAAANPIGNALMMVRADSLAGLVSADGDNVAARGTDKGELYVKHADTIAATQSGTWNVGAISTSITPGTGATHLGKAEDAAHSSGDVGVMVLTVRQDTATALSGTDGDYQPLITDANGKLHVIVGNTVAVGQAGATNIAKAEDTAFANADVGAAVMAVRQDTPGNTSGADGDYEFLQISGGRLWTSTTVTSLPASTNTIEVVGDAAHDAAAAGNPLLMGGYAKAAAPTDVSADGDAVNAWFLRNGAQATVITAAGALIGGDATNGLDVDVTRVQGSVTVAQATAGNLNATVVGTGTFATQVTGDALTALQLIDNIVSNIDTATGGTNAGVVALATRDDALSTLTPAEGDNVQLRVDANGALWTVVSGTVTVGSHNVTNAGTFAVQVTSLPASTNTIEVVGDAAHDAAAAGNPILMGGYSKAAAPADTSADGDAVNAWFLRNGAQAVNVTAAGALIGGDATNGLDVDVTRVQGSVTVAQATAGNLNATVVGTGTFAVQVDGSALTALQLIDDTIFADDAAFTPASSKVSAIGCLADESSTDSVDEGDIGIPRMTLDRKQHVVAETEGATIRESGTALTVKRAPFGVASSGENTLVAAVASKKIRVLSLAIIAAGAVNVYFNNATDGAVFGHATNKITLDAGGAGFVLPHNPHGWFQTGTNNEALRINLSGAVAVSGGLTYVEV